MKEKQLYIGVYTGGGSRGIYRCGYCGADGRLEGPVLAAEAENPSYLAFSPAGNTLFAVEETAVFRGESSGSVAAFSCDEEGSLNLRDRFPSGGASPCHLWTDGAHVWAANYMGCSWSQIALSPQGTFERFLRLVRHSGKADGDGQRNAPHIHWVGQSPYSPHLWAVNVGADRIDLYDGREVAPVHTARLPEGSGPRHLAFHPTLRVAYAVQENANTVSVFPIGPHGLPEECAQEISTLPEGFAGRSACAAIRVGSDGRFLYASNRGDDSVAVFQVHEHTGLLARCQIASSGGADPRDIALSPDGKWLYCANQTTNTVTALAVHSSQGTLSTTEIALEIDRPVCLLFRPCN